MNFAYENFTASQPTRVARSAHHCTTVVSEVWKDDASEDVKFDNPKDDILHFLNVIIKEIKSPLQQDR
jgi:hypothetical protein